MDWTELISKILFIIITGCGVAVAKQIVVFINKKIDELQKDVKNEQLSNYIDYAQEVVDKVVLSVCQTFVDNIKTAEGRLTKENAIKAKDMAVEKATSMITNEAKIAIANLYGDFQMWLDNTIEASVRENKLEIIE